MSVGEFVKYPLDAKNSSKLASSLAKYTNLLNDAVAWSTALILCHKTPQVRRDLIWYIWHYFFDEGYVCKTMGPCLLFLSIQKVDFPSHSRLASSCRTARGPLNFSFLCARKCWNYTTTKWQSPSLWPCSPHLYIGTLKSRSFVAYFLLFGQRPILISSFNSSKYYYFIIYLSDFYIIDRLTETWAALGEGMPERAKAINDLFSPLKNFLKYRKLMREIECPATGWPCPVFFCWDITPFNWVSYSCNSIVYLGVALRDLIYIHDSSPSLVGRHRHLVNFSKVINSQSQSQSFSLSITWDISLTFVSYLHASSDPRNPYFGPELAHPPHDWCQPHGEYDEWKDIKVEYLRKLWLNRLILFW